MTDTATAWGASTRVADAAPSRPRRLPARPGPADSPRPGGGRRAPVRSDRRMPARATRPRVAPVPAPARDKSRDKSRDESRDTAPDAAGTAPFVLLIMVLLAAGLVATLWLSTAAAADSYRLEDARNGTRDLSEQAEQLRRQVEDMQSAPSIANAATALGMVPAGAPAVLLVRPDGSTELVGTPAAASAAPAPTSVPALPAVPPATAVSTPAASTPAASTPAASTPAVPTPTADPEGPR